jgi:hypothetical protein
MLPIYQLDHQTTRSHDSALTNTKRMKSHKRLSRTGRSHDAFERSIEVNPFGTTGLGELNHEMVAVLHRVAE